ncbi:sporulation protein [Catellatospora sp. TT07R-123]|uniref:sporulation protein n=1 Tax=Catellatospora sp. TT07R-123 TaxID=2733863 RepID=UPI001B203EA5|nr:sporulation protein [Catellatospora sp. TT07R-123]GHJ44444.1 sporulation protein [Catellatospora sp. TT07R-123]
MVFKRMLSALGVGGPSVDTVLSTPVVRPGGILAGQVHIRGGERDTLIEYVSIGLVTRVEVEHGDSEYGSTVEFQHVRLTGAFTLAAGATQTLPFQLEIPWEAPVTAFYGTPLRGMTMGVHTELSVANAVDKTDLDAVAIEPLPLQAEIMEAFTRMGFQFARADLERGRIHGVHQTLPFYQEIEFYPAPAYSGRMRQLELTFVTSPHGMDVVLEFDKRGFGSHDSFSRHHVSHADAGRTDWTAVIDGWIRQALERHGSHGYGHQQYGHQQYGHQQYGHGYGHHGGHGHGGDGYGMGTVVAAGAAGFLGGMVAGEIAEEVFDFDDDGGFFE